MHVLARSILLGALMTGLWGCGPARDKEEAVDLDEAGEAGPAGEGTGDVIDPCLQRPTSLPATLSATALFSNVAAGSLCPAVKTFMPAATLWSDGADKQRFYRLPEGAVIDASDVDHWNFPVGTMFWKEFKVNGVRVETRTMLRVANGEGLEGLGWEMAAYHWNADGADAVKVVEGVANANGSGWNIPTAVECMGCHRHEKSGVLGFNALMLSGDDQLKDLVDSAMLSPAPHTLRAPAHDWPKVQKDALLYLSINCGHCHQAGADGFEWTAGDTAVGLGLRVSFSDVDVGSTLAATTTTAPLLSPLDDGARQQRVVPGHPEESGLFLRMTTRGAWQMPPLGTDVVDDEGGALVSAWIVSLGS